MAKVISQDTFDDVVKENIVEFAMSPDEAKQETIKQFEAQGINLANIIKDLNINAESGKPILNESIENLKIHLDNNSKEEQQLLEYLKAMEEECQKSIPHRVLAAKNNVNCLLLQILEQQLELEESKRNTEVLEATLKTLN
ncbi:hypothetical protein DOY81_014081, partial [Sarcophaga bullata]